MSRFNNTEDGSLDTMKNINPVLFDLIMCNSRGSRISELKKILNYDSRSASAPKYIEKSPLTHRTMERKRKAEGKLPELKHEDSSAFLTDILTNEQKPKTTKTDRLGRGTYDQLRETLMRELTPPFKTRKTSKTSEDRRKASKEPIEISMSNFTEEENVKQTKLMSIYEKKQMTELRGSPALVNILRYIEEARTPRDRSLFWDDYEYIQRMIMEEREPLSKKENEKTIEKTKKIVKKQPLKFKESYIEPVNMFERDLPKALRQRITDIKNNPSLMKKLKEMKRNKKKAPVIQEIQENHDGFDGDDGLEEGAMEIPFLGPIRNNEISNIILLLLKKERTIQLFEADTRNDFYVFLDQSRLQFWQSLVVRSIFLQNVHSLFLSNKELSNTKQQQAEKPKELQKFSRNQYVARMLYKINRKKIAAEIIRRSFISFLDAKLVYKAMQKLRANMITCRDMIRSYLEIKKARLLLLRLQFQKLEGSVRTITMASLMNSILKSKSTNIIHLNGEMRKEYIKLHKAVRNANQHRDEPSRNSPSPEPFRGSPSPEPGKGLHDHEENISAVPIEVVNKVIKEDYVIRRQLFMKKVFDSTSKQYFKCLLDSDRMYQLVVMARTRAASMLEKKRNSIFLNVE